MVKGEGQVRVAGRDRHYRTEGHSGEISTTIRRLLHNAGRVVRIVSHHDAVTRRDMEVAEQVTLAERRDEQFLGIPSIGIAVEHPVRRPADLVFTLGADDVITPVGPVVAGAGSAISCPFDRDGEVVFMIHTLNVTPGRR